MRWGVRRDPLVGDTRTVRRFFLFPRKFGDTWIWLEFGEVVQRRVETYSHGYGPLIESVEEWQDESLVIK